MVGADDSDLDDDELERDQPDAVSMGAVARPEDQGGTP
jgi:hypothetical protein